MTAPAEMSVVDSILRTDFLSFIEKCFGELNSGTPYRPNWHIEAMAHELEGCRTGANRRLIITVPPRSLKSLCASIAFPAFLLGHDPSQRLINVSYSLELGAKFTSGFRQVMNSNWYRRFFRATRAARDTEGEFETTRGGGRAIGGATGRGCGCGICGMWPYEHGPWRKPWHPVRTTPTPLPNPRSFVGLLDESPRGRCGHTPTLSIRGGRARCGRRSICRSAC